MGSQTAWVTGGGTGIGLGVARALANDGFTVYISGRRESVLAKAADTYEGAGTLVSAPADVTSDSDLSGVVSRIQTDTGRIDVLTLCAGINVTNRTINDTTPDEWRRILDVNATGAFVALKAALPIMATDDRDGGGLVVNVSSIAGVRALQMAGVAYASSKFASLALGIMAGNELADRGIRVTNIYPGEVNTPILDQRTVPPTPERRAQMVRPEDIGEMVSLIVRLPATTHVSEMVIKPRYQELT